ncbi:MAG: nitroreductase family protein [Thermodesulfobacteriota bacterium]
MEVFECVSTLSSIRSYYDKEVEMSIIRKVLESGRLAPSAHNDQPWEFILITDKEKLKGMGSYCLSGSFISQVPFAIVILSDKNSKWHEIDTTRAVQNMVLTAWSLKLGSCWIGRLDTNGLKKFLEIPDKWNVLTVLPFGYFNEKLMTTNKYRKAPGEVFHLNVYGNKFIE